MPQVLAGSTNLRISTRSTANTGGVRVSIHFFNDEGDIERLLMGIASFLRS
ncbi:MAG: hypothetical protein ACC658_05150 [Acidimicrobiia bacterium]